MQSINDPVFIWNLDLTGGGQLLSLEERLGRIRKGTFVIKITGNVPIPLDEGLALWSLIGTAGGHLEIVTLAYVPLRGGEILLWLAGHKRSILTEAYLEVPALSGPPPDKVSEKGTVQILIQENIHPGLPLLWGILDAYLPLDTCAGRILRREDLAEMGLFDRRLPPQVEALFNSTSAPEKNSPSDDNQAPKDRQ